MIEAVPKGRPEADIKVPNTNTYTLQIGRLTVLGSN